MNGIPGGKLGGSLVDPCDTDFVPVSPADVVVDVVYPNDDDDDARVDDDVDDNTDEDDVLLRLPDTRLFEPNEDCPCLASRPASLELGNVEVACDTLLLELILLDK